MLFCQKVSIAKDLQIIPFLVPLYKPFIYLYWVISLFSTVMWSNIIYNLLQVLGPDNVPGYDKVLDLSEFLVQLRDERALTFEQVNTLTSLWNKLSEFDKKRTVFPRRYTQKPWSGKFGGRGKHVAPGVESITK